MALIGISIAHPTSRLLSSIDVPGESEDSNNHHITILHFEGELPIKTVSKIMKNVFDVTSKFPPFLITINKVSCFPKRENNPCAIIAKIECKELHNLHNQLKKSLDHDNIEYSKTFKEYKPHITLSYADKEIKELSIDPIEFAVQEIKLWAGSNGDDRLSITFPLKPPSVKNAMTLHKADLLYKFATYL